MAIILIRTLIIFLALIVAMRLMGKRQLGELELSELVVAVLIADIASIPLQNPSLPLSYGLIPLLVLFCCELIFSGLTYKSIRLRKLLYGRPNFIIERGRIAQQAMHRNRFTLDELTQELRNQGILDIASVEYAVLETNGQLNIILAPAQRRSRPSRCRSKPRTPVIFPFSSTTGASCATISSAWGAMSAGCKSRCSSAAHSALRTSIC